MLNFNVFLWPAYLQNFKYIRNIEDEYPPNYPNLKHLEATDQMYVCTSVLLGGPAGFLRVPLRGPLSLAGPTPVLVKFKHIFVIFSFFRRSCRIFSSVLVKVHFRNQSLTQKILKMYFYEDHKKYHLKYCFFRFYSCNNYYL